MPPSSCLVPSWEYLWRLPCHAQFGLAPRVAVPAPRIRIRSLGMETRSLGSRSGRPGAKPEAPDGNPAIREHKEAAGMETRRSGKGKNRPGRALSRSESLVAGRNASWSAGPWTLARGRPYTVEVAFRALQHALEGEGSLTNEVRQEAGRAGRPPGVVVSGVGHSWVRLTRSTQLRGEPLCESYSKRRYATSRKAASVRGVSMKHDSRGQEAEPGARRDG
jgi:hypothetical protein